MIYYNVCTSIPVYWVTEELVVSYWCHGVRQIDMCYSQLADCEAKAFKEH